MPHLDAVPLAEGGEPEIRERFEHYRRTRGFTPSSIMTMVRRPNIVGAFTALNQAVPYCEAPGPWSIGRSLGIPRDHAAAPQSPILAPR